MNNNEENGFNNIGKRLGDISEIKPVKSDDIKLESSTNNKSESRASANTTLNRDTNKPSINQFPLPHQKKAFNPVKAILAVIFGIPPVWLIIIVIVGFFIIQEQYSGWKKSKVNSAFAGELSNLQTYNDISYGKPHLTSKLVVLDSASSSIDQTYYDLPDNIKAENINDVGAVALISCSETRVGKYNSGSIGYRTDCYVSIIDRRTLLKYESTIVGAEPPQTKKGGGDWRQRPNTKIANYLKSLY